MSNVKLLVGGNFSGRSRRLLDIKNASDSNPGAKRILIGELPGDYLSGIFPTVGDELKGHTRLRNSAAASGAWRMLDRIGYDRLLSRNPFELSGGEQAMLAVVSHLLMEPGYLGLDTVLEQLSPAWRLEVLNLLGIIESEVYIADNRYRDLAQLDLAAVEVAQPCETHAVRFAQPDFSLALPPPPTKVKVELDGLGFAYSRTKVFQNLSLQLEPGRIYHLQGQNGAGKSTLSKILCGVLKPNKGTIAVNNERTVPYRKPGSLFGYSFQNPDDQLQYSTVGEQLRANGPRDIKRVQRIEQIIRIFGLTGLENMHPADLPFTMRKRLALASTFAVPRPWYIVDEPNLGQDDQWLECFYSWLNLLGASGSGIVVITHAPNILSSIRSVPIELAPACSNEQNG